MKSLVINFMGNSKNTKVASTRIAIWINNQYEKRFGVEQTHFWHSKKTQPKEKKFETIFIVNGPFLYCGFREELLGFLSKAIFSRLVWVSNEWLPSTWIPKPIIEICSNKIEIWGNHNKTKKHSFHHKKLNWNVLTWEPVECGKNKREELFYWGAWRKNRVETFQKYFGPNAKYEVAISPSSLKQKKNWVELNQNINFVETNAQLQKIIRHFAATIYLKDKKQPDGFCPANRFYEAISSGTLLLVDENCRSELCEQNKLEIPPDFFVHCADDVYGRMNQFEALTKHQNEVVFPQAQAHFLAFKNDFFCVMT